MKKIAVVLSGCGYLDGAEITEAVSSLVCLSELGVEYKCFAPDMEVVEMDHILGKENNNKINLLQQSARIARGKVESLENLDEKQFDAILLPGGYGAAKYLSNFAVNGSKGEVHPKLDQVLKSFYDSSKPIAALCIAPAILALSLGSKSIQLTIGNDKATASEIEKTGAQHVDCNVDDFVTDRENKIITSPAYMYEAKPHLIFKGIKKAIQELVEMA